MAGLSILLEQLAPLLLDPDDRLLILLHPRRQILEHPMDLLRVPTRLGFPLLGDSKLDAHISLQSGLLGEAVPFHLLLMEEPGLLLATSNEGLKRRPVSKIQKNMKTRRKRDERLNGYPAIGNDDVAKDDLGLI